MANLQNLSRFNALITSEKTQDYLAKVLGEKKQSFVSSLTSIVANNEALQKVEPVTLMYAAIKATALSLPLDQNLGFAYVIPYGNKAQFQIGYKGFIQLALRSNQFKTINVTDVREGEISYYDRLTGEMQFEWLDDNERAGKHVLGFIAYFKLLNGFEKSLYMTKDEISKHALRFSQTFKKGYGVWKDDFDSMAKKTVLKLLLSKYAPMSIELAEAIQYDQSVIQDDTPEYPDNDTVIDIEKNNADEMINRVLEFVANAKTQKDLQKIQNEVPIEILDSVIGAIDEKRNQLKK